MTQDKARKLRPLVELLRDPPTDADVPATLKTAFQTLKSAVATIPAETRKKWEYEVMLSAASNDVRQALGLKDD